MSKFYRWEKGDKKHLIFTYKCTVDDMFRSSWGL